MTDLSQFPVTRRWPPQNPDIIQLYSFTTPNGQKASIALEELGLDYEVQKVSIFGDVDTPEFLSLNPNNKIPAIIDPHGPDGTPLPLFESGAILNYLGEKTGRLLGSTASERHHILQWLMFQMGGIGPFFGQMGYFVKMSGKDIEDPRPRERYVNESKRLLRVLDTSLEGRDWIAGAYSIADIAICPWLRTARDFYEVGDLVGWAELRHVPAYLDRFLDRPAVQRGLEQPPRD